MISLEQVQLLEEKVSKAIEYVKRVNAENAALLSEKAVLLSKLEANQKRIDELEVHVLAFKEDQSRIEDGIIAALDRLSQFEEAFENSLKPLGKKLPATPKAKENPQPENNQTAKPETNQKYFELSGEDSALAAEEDDAGAEDEKEETASADAELDIF